MVILVVDDDPVSRLVAEHILQSGGHEVHAAKSAEEAAALTARDGFEVDIIVCDYNMPGASGLDLLVELAQRSDSTPPFVLMTGVSEANDLDDSRAEMVSAYVTKPVESTYLLDLVDRLVSTAD